MHRGCEINHMDLKKKNIIRSKYQMDYTAYYGLIIMLD